MASASSSRTSSPFQQRRRRRSSTVELQSPYPEYNYAHDSSISEWLKCPICLNPFVEPIQASSCEHIFCKECIHLHLTSSSPSSYSSRQHQDGDGDVNQKDSQCPSCRSPLSQKHLKPAAALIRNMVDSLLVECPHEKRGCLHVCERSHVDTHAKRDCGWAYLGEYSVQAGNRKSSRGRCECGKKVLKKDWAAHIKDGQCSVTRMKCKNADVINGCDAMLKEDEMEEHVAICPAQPLFCSHCEIELPRAQMELHEDSCEEALVLCKLVRFGCNWNGTRRLCELHHMSQCHLIPLETYLLKQEEEVALLRGENSKLEESIKGIKREQVKTMTMVQQCISCLGSTYMNRDAFASLASQTFDTAVQDISIQATSSTPSLNTNDTLSVSEADPPQSHTSTALGIAFMPHRPQYEVDFTSEDFHHIASNSAPTSRADLAWQWPNPSISPSSRTTAPVASSQATTVSDSLAEIDKKLSNIFEHLKQVDRKMEDNHVLGLNANFEASRAHEELNSVRHGLHALRMTLLMQQQRSMPGNAYIPGQTPIDNRNSDSGSTNVATPNTMPFANGLGPSMIGLRRFWTGFEHTKL